MVSIADTVSLAARNAWALTLGAGVREPEPTSATVLWDQPHRQLRRFRKAAPDASDPIRGVESTASDAAVLLIPPLAAPASCFDLSPEQSVAGFLLDTGRVPYVIDYGEIGFSDRRMGLEDWVDDILPEAILRTSADRGGAPVDLVGWSLGGTMSLLTAAANAELPIRSISAIGAPLDYTAMPGIPQLRSVAELTGGLATSTAIRAAGGVPAPLTRFAYRATAWERELRRPWFVASNITHTETLARMETIDRFMAAMPGYPGRFYGQVWGRLVLHNDLGRGVVRLGQRSIALADVTASVLLVGGSADVITPAAAVRAGLRTLSGAASVQYETVPGSHLGILSGATAPDTTWCYLDKFLAMAQ